MIEHQQPDARHETTGRMIGKVATSEHKQSLALSSNSARERPRINPEVADQIGALALRFTPRRDETAAEARTRLRLLMEDVSQALDTPALAASIRAGVAVWRFMPTCAEICEQAADFLADRRADARRAYRAPPSALPPPETMTRADLDAALDAMRAKLDAGHHAIMGTTDTTRPRRIIPPGPQRNPTGADYAELAAIMSSRRAA